MTSQNMTLRNLGVSQSGRRPGVSQRFRLQIHLCTLNQVHIPYKWQPDCLGLVDAKSFLEDKRSPEADKIGRKHHQDPKQFLV